MNNEKHFVMMKKSSIGITQRAFLKSLFFYIPHHLPLPFLAPPTYPLVFPNLPLPYPFYATHLPHLLPLPSPEFTCVTTCDIRYSSDVSHECNVSFCMPSVVSAVHTDIYFFLPGFCILLASARFSND